jgi:hypothetical protein
MMMMSDMTLNYDDDDDGRYDLNYDDDRRYDLMGDLT